MTQNQNKPDLHREGKQGHEGFTAGLQRKLRKTLTAIVAGQIPKS